MTVGSAVASSHLPVLDAPRQAVLEWALLGSDSRDPVEVPAPLLADMLAWCHAERFEGLLRGAAESGRIQVDAPSFEAIRAADVEALRRTLACEAIAAEVVAIFSERGIRSRLIKGLAAAHLDHPDPGLRGSVDVDLLVSRADLLGASAVLAEAGWPRVEQHLPDWWEARYGRALVHHSPEGVELDLHAALAPGYFGLRLPMARLLDPRGDVVDLGGVRVDTLDRPGRLLHSGYALVLSRGTSLRIARDLAQQLQLAGDGWTLAVDLARSGDGEAVLAEALLRTSALLPSVSSHPAHTWASSIKATGRAARALRYAERAHTHGWSADARSALLALGPIDRSRFVFGATVRSKPRH